MVHSLLTTDDIEFLNELQLWFRGSLEFAVLQNTPADSDLVFIQNSSIPYIRLSLGKLTFVSLRRLRELCENLAAQQTIFEVWLQHSLHNAHRFSRALSSDDALRFMHYFKAYHEILDETALAQEAEDAIREARQALYGSDD